MSTRLRWLDRFRVTVYIIMLSFVIVTGVFADMSVWKETYQTSEFTKTHDVLYDKLTTVPLRGFTLREGPYDRIVASSMFLSFLYESPERSLHTVHLYTDEDDKLWGSYYYRSNFIHYEGWVQMSNMRLYYDRYAFNWEHGDEFVQASDFVVDGFTVRDYPWAADDPEEISHVFSGRPNDSIDIVDYGSDGFTLWAYPGAPDPVVVNYRGPGPSWEVEYISAVWVDEQGVAWGELHGDRSSDYYWFVLDDPGCVSVSERDVSGIEYYFADVSLTSEVRGHGDDVRVVLTMGPERIESFVVVVMIIFCTLCVSGTGLILFNIIWPAVDRDIYPRRGMLTRRGGGPIGYGPDKE